MSESSASEIRLAARAGASMHTAGYCSENAQANLVVLRSNMALEFAAFCMRNRRACPLLEIMAPGDPEPVMSAPGSDIRTDLGRYRVFLDGTPTKSVSDITPIWEGDMVAFLLGCSATFEHALVAAGIRLDYLKVGGFAPTYVTSLQTKPTERFGGPLVVSMRPVRRAMLSVVLEISARYPEAHGVPIHIGDPSTIGVDIETPDFGENVSLFPDEVPVFWACGVTPQLAAQHAKPDIMITHDPGYMLVTDLTRDSFMSVGF